MKDLAYSCGVAGHPHGKEALSEVIIRALWKSYPNLTSEDAIAEEAAKDFRNDDGSPVSKRTIKYWLRGQTLPSVLHFSTLVMMQPRMFMVFWFGRLWG